MNVNDEWLFLIIAYAHGDRPLASKRESQECNPISCGSFVRASMISSDPAAQAAKCRGAIPPAPTRLGEKMYFLDELLVTE